MKKALFVLFYSFLSVMLYGQGLAVSADKMNVAYVGIDNPLTIVAEGYDCSQLIVTSNNGKLIKGEDCQYNFSPDKQGTCDINVSVKTKTGIKHVGIKKYRAKLLPSPRVALAGKSEGRISTAVFKQQLGISMIFDNCEYEIKGAVTKFRIVFLYVEGTAFEAENSGANFSPEVQQEMKKLKLGDKIVVENIKGIVANGMTRSFNSMTFTLY